MYIVYVNMPVCIVDGWVDVSVNVNVGIYVYLWSGFSLQMK